MSPPAGQAVIGKRVRFSLPGVHGRGCVAPVKHAIGRCPCPGDGERPSPMRRPSEQHRAVMVRPSRRRSPSVARRSFAFRTPRSSRAALAAIASNTGWTSVGELEITRRISTGDHQDFGRGRLLLERLFRLVEQPHVLDGDDGLVGEGLEEGDLILGEGPHLSAVERDGAKKTRLAHQGHAQEGSHSLLLDVVGPERLPPAIRLGLAHVENVNRLPGAACPKERPAEPLRFLQQGPGFRSGTADLGGPEQFVLVTPERPELGAGQGHRLVENSREDWTEVGRRAGDHPQDLGGRRLLLQRLAERSPEAFDLAFGSAWDRVAGLAPVKGPHIPRRTSPAGGSRAGTGDTACRAPPLTERGQGSTDNWPLSGRPP